MRHSSALAELARTEDATIKCGLERFLRKRARRPLFSVGEVAQLHGRDQFGVPE